ncbi:hypothetical protein D3C80_1410210 [compost metagenome]
MQRGSLVLHAEHAAQVRRGGRTAQRQAEAQHVLVLRLVGAAPRTAGGKPQVSPGKATVVAGLEGDVAALPGCPVVLRAAAEVEATGIARKRLGDVQLEAVALAEGKIGRVRRAASDSRIVAEVEVALAGEAVGCQGEVGAAAIQHLAVGQPVAAPVHVSADAGLVFGQVAGTRLGDVGRHGAQRGVQGYPRLGGKIMIGDDAAKVARPAVGDPPLIGALNEVGDAAQVVVAVATQADAVA